MEEQMRKERAEATKASEHQLQAIMLELRAFKEKHEKDTKERKVEEKTLLENIKASIDPVLKRDHKTSDQIGIGTRLKHLQEEVTNYLPPTVNKKRGAAVTNDDTFGDLTLGGYRDTKHVHFASTPIRPEISNINLTPPRTQKEETIAESVLPLACTNNNTKKMRLLCTNQCVLFCPVLSIFGRHLLGNMTPKLNRGCVTFIERFVQFLPQVS